MILYEFFARFSSGLGFCALFRPTRRFSFIGLFRLSYLELVLLNPNAGDYLDWTLPGDRYGPFGPAHVPALCGGEYVLLSARDASGPEKASDDRAARCAGGDSAVLGGDLSNGREPVYLF